MSDGFTSVQSVGILRRLGQSVVAMVFGIACIVGSVFLLNWNERHAVTVARGLAEATAAVVEADAGTVNPANERHLVHVVGRMAPTATVSDPAFGSAGLDVLRIERTVEMYQWRENESTSSSTSFGGTRTTTTSYSYQKVWSTAAIDGAHFHEPQHNHVNPPMPIRSLTSTNNDVRLGAYRVEPAITSALGEFTPIPPLTGFAPDQGYRVDGDYLYRGESSAGPQIGDLRIKFGTVSAETVSVLAAQAGGRLAPYRAPNGYQVALALPGVMSADALITAKRHEESLQTWMWRGGGFLLMLVGFRFAMDPLAVVASIVLGEAAGYGAGAIAFLLAMPLTALTIAIFWFGHRPVFGVGLIVGAILLATAVHVLRQRRRAAASG
jgi:hypothetical protein